MKEVVLSEKIRFQLTQIYKELQQEYERVADVLKFSCTGCPDNCCDSYFLHYTYLEWAYLWEGIRELEPNVKDNLIQQAAKYLEASGQALQNEERPEIMCPLNLDGLCFLYKHRLLVCRTHGVPAIMTRPDGKSLRFPGCFRCQEIVQNNPPGSFPQVDRTHLLRKLAMLEQQLLENKRYLLPKVKLTIAEMIVKGPPLLAKPHCEK